MSNTTNHPLYSYTVTPIADEKALIVECNVPVLDGRRFKLSNFVYDEKMAYFNLAEEIAGGWVDVPSDDLKTAQAIEDVLWSFSEDLTKFDSKEQNT